MYVGILFTTFAYISPTKTISRTLYKRIKTGKLALTCSHWQSIKEASGAMVWHFPTQGLCPAPTRGLACTSTRICSAANLCYCINYKPANHSLFRNLPIKIQLFKTLWPHPDIRTCNEGDTVGSTWILNVQPMRRRQLDDGPSDFNMHTAHMAEEIWGKENA